MADNFLSTQPAVKLTCVAWQDNTDLILITPDEQLSFLFFTFGWRRFFLSSGYFFRRPRNAKSPNVLN